MLPIVVIGIVCALLTVLFFMLEVHQSLANLNNFLAANKGYSRIRIIWQLPKCFWPLISDTSVTLFAVWLFGMQGMMGMFTSMVVSVCSSLYFQARLLRHPIKF